jgi:flavin-dependent dehydrogenase
MTDEGWFWVIHINDTVTSVGFVTRPDFCKRINVPANQMLQWAIARCPVVRHRMRNATGPTANKTLADFSYTCRPHAGEGYFLVGDAGCFLDPIFSTGVTLAMIGGNECAKIVTQMLRGQLMPLAARTKYIRFVERSTAPFWKLIRSYYRHSFRELFMNGTGPCQVHKAVISTLAGQVFPRPVWALRWRLMLFHFCVAAQEKLPVLVPRRKHCSLLAETPVERPVPELAHA